MWIGTIAEADAGVGYIFGEGIAKPSGCAPDGVRSIEASTSKHSSVARSLRTWRCGALRTQSRRRRVIPPTIGATFVQGTHLPATHLTDHALRGTGLPEVISRAHQSRFTMQMPSNDRARGRH